MAIDADSQSCWRERPLWSTVFHRARGTEATFLVNADRRAKTVAIVRDLGLPSVVQADMFDDRHETWPVLDGALSAMKGYGFHASRSGVRVYGLQALRVLCEVLDLRPPRWTSEPNQRPAKQLLAAFEVQRRLPPHETLRSTRFAMQQRIGEIADASRLLGAPPSRGRHLAAVGAVPRRYYVTPTMTVDADEGVKIASADAATLIRVGLNVSVRSETTARNVLASFAMTQSEIESAVRFGQTGRV